MRLRNSIIRRWKAVQLQLSGSPAIVEAWNLLGRVQTLLDTAEHVFRAQASLAYAKVSLRHFLSSTFCSGEKWKSRQALRSIQASLCLQY